MSALAAWRALSFMFSFSPTLRYSDSNLPVAAGWVACGDAAVWMEEARRVCETVPGAEVRFYPLAVSARDHAAGGAVLVVSGANVALEKVLGPRVMRLGFALPGVLVPVGARLLPALTEAEARRVFPWGLQVVHPVLGVTGFEESDAVAPEQLVALPVVERMGWFAAVPGPAEPPPLQEITLVQEVTLEELMGGEGGDIASERPDRKDKSPKPGADLLGRAAGAVGSGLAGLGAGILRTLGAGSVADKMGAWSQKMWTEVMDHRQRELNKLLDRFDKDTLDALRHAIPLTGAESRRGAAPQPGWQLGARSLDLNARSHGSGPVDVWDINAETRLKLERRYREAAGKEAAAGQFGRAAYIYGELLGDWNMAAQMLEKAGRPREAARIYLDRLRSGAKAAECLEKAGLLAEAAALYREAGMHEKAGDVLAQLGNEEAAREQWRQALQRMSNALEQARLLETKLRDVDRALFVLDRAWPGSPQALACFEAEFALLGRHERHTEAAEVLARLERNPKARLNLVTATVSGLRTVFQKYPDSTVRERAAELAVQFTGEFLSREPKGASAKQLLAALPQFAPGDRLLSRDAGRFGIGHNKPDVPLLARMEKVLRVERVVELGSKTEWRSLASHSRTLSAAGWKETAAVGRAFPYRSLVIGDGDEPGAELWDGMPPYKCRMEHLLYSEEANPVYLFRDQQLVMWSLDWNVELEAGCLAIGITSDPREFVRLEYTNTASLIVSYFGSARAQAPRVLDLAPPSIKDADWFVGGHGDDIWVAGPGVVCCVNEKVEFQTAHLNGPVTGFAVAPAVLASQAIAVASGEAVLLIAHGGTKPLESVNLWSGTTEAPQVVTFTRDGRAVIADAGGGVVYALRKSCEKSADIVIPPGSGNLISAAPHGAQGFAFLTSTGKVLLFA
jgi:tetratricopeptide (TPR) repeat protein